MNVLFDLLLFVAAVIFYFYLPGRFLLYKLKLDVTALESFFVATSLGLLQFLLLAYIFAWMNLSILLLPLLIAIDIIALRTKDIFVFKKYSIHWHSIVFIFVCALVFSSSMLVSGLYGDSFHYRRDDIWHLALINDLKVNFPPHNPGFAEVPLKGYHFFYNLIIAEVSTLSRISHLSLHFHLFPLLFGFLWAYGVYAFMLKWTGKNAAGLWGVFLSLFGGSFAFILPLIGIEMLNLDSGLGIQQPMFTLYNMPSSLSFIIIILSLFSFHGYLTSHKKSWLIPLTLCVGLAPMSKVYAGIILIGGLGVLTLLQLFKKQFVVLLAALGAGILYLTTFGIFAAGTGYLFFFPFWHREGILRVLTWFGWDEKISTYTRLDVIRGLVETSTVGLFIFLIGNLGTRVIGLLALVMLIFKKKQRPSQFALIMLAMMLFSILLPLFFLQSGKVYEMIQMATYYLFFGALFAGLGFAVLFEQKFPRSLKYILAGLIILATLPSVLFTLQGNTQARGAAINITTDDYFQAMNYLQTEGDYTDTIVEIPPKNTFSSEPSFHGWYEASSVAITAFGNKRGFFANEYSKFYGIPFDERKEILRKIVYAADTDPQALEKLLTDNSISYIFSPYELPAVNKSERIKKVFQNDTTVIYSF